MKDYLSPADLLTQIRQHLDAEALSQAEILLRTGPPPEGDADLCFQWGLYCEEAGLLSEAIQAFQQTLHRQANHSEAAYRLALLYLDQNAPEKALPHLQHVVKLNPAHTDAARELAILLAERGERALAAEVCRHALDSSPTEALEQLLHTLTPPMSPSVPNTFEDFPPGFVSYFLQRFSGREGVYARQWVDAAGRSGYTPVKEPLTEREVRSHLRGDITVGVYPLRLDNTVNFLSIDIDISKKALEQSRNDPQELERLQALAQSQAKALVRTGETVGLSLSLSIEESGYKGRHLWLFLEHPLEAQRVRDLGKLLLTLTGNPPIEIQREIFPKQDTLPLEALGNLIKLPLGIHRRTGKRSVFLDPEGHLFADQYAVLQRATLASPEQIARAIDLAIQRRDRLSFDQEAKPWPVKSEAEEGPQSAALTALRAGCSVINYLLEKAATEHHLTHDERMVLLCTIPHLPDGAVLLHRIIQQCVDYDPRITQSWIERCPPNPISCPRIRTRLSEVTRKVGCSCAFPLPPNGYPSPLLHWNPQATAGKAGTKTEDRITATITRLFEFRTQLRALQTRMQQCEQELITLMQEQEMEEVHTVFGRLRRRTDAEGKGWILEIDEAQG